MDFCFSKDFLGTSNHLVVSNRKVLRSSSIPDTAWCLGYKNIPACVDELCQIYNIDSPKIYTSVEAKTFSSLGRDINSVPWGQVLGFEECIKRLIDISRRLELMFESTFNEKYVDIYISSRRVLERLDYSIVDPVKLAEFIKNESNSSLKTCLKTFRPSRDCTLARPVYSQSVTSTGRLTVLNGPSILTLPQRYRSIIQSRFLRGKVLSIDFKSLEPRVALAVQNKTAPNDVYTHVSQNILSGSANRKVSKLATIASLYGTSFGKFREMSGCKDPQILHAVREFFGVARLIKRLDTNQFVNHFGRPLDNSTPSHRRISHYVQSTSCDVVNCAFGDFLDEFPRKYVVPLFLLHDALVIDVDESYIEQVRKKAEEGLQTMLGNFPVSCENFS